jgi:hypothetical protein
MHRTGTRIQRHVVAQDRRNVEVQERVLKRISSSASPFTVPSTV